MSDEKKTIKGATCVYNSKNAIRVVSPEYSGWVPQSAVHADSEVYKSGQSGDLVVVAWFAEKNDLELD